MTGCKRRKAILLFLLVFGTSCIPKENPNKKLLVVPFGDFLEESNSCRLDFLEFRHILEKDATSSIECLRINLKHFSKLVDLEDDSVINHKEFQQFVHKFFPEISPQISEELIRVIFQVFSFILQDPIGSISVDKIDRLTRFISLVSQDVGPLFRRFRDLEPKDYWKERFKLHKDIRLVNNKAQTFIKGIPKNKVQINTLDLAKDLKNIFDLDDARFQPFPPLAFLMKKLFLGGKKETMAQENLIVFFEKLPSALEIVFDVAFIDSKPDKKAGERSLVYYQGLEQISALFYPLDDNENLIKHSELMRILNRLIPFESNIISIIGNVLQGVKPKVLGGNSEEWRFENVRRLNELARHYFGGNYFNTITSERLYRQDTGTSEITLKKLQLDPTYQVFSQDDLEKYWKQFHLVISQYRYFQDVHEKVLEIGHRESLIRPQGTDTGMLDQILFQDELRMYQSRYKKALEHLNHVVPIRGLLEEITPYYNSKGSVSDIYVEEIQELLNDLAPAFGKKRSSFQSLAEEILQTSDFFQFQSNGDGKTDIDELTEYSLNVLYAFKLGTLLYNDIVQDCPVLEDRIEINCYREKFLTTFFGEQHYLDHFENLLEDPHMQDLEVFRDYLDDLEKYSKSDEDTREDSISKTGLVRLMVAFLNIEGLFAHFDENKDGEIGRGELKEKAYPVFKHLIIKMSKGKLSEEKEDLVLSAFLYLVKYGKLPKGIKLILFNQKSDEEKDRIIATRKGISKLLVNVFKRSSQK